jgi:hypothetical protein
MKEVGKSIREGIKSIDADNRLLTAVQNGGAGEVSRRFNLAAHMSAVL